MVTRQRVAHHNAVRSRRVKFTVRRVPHLDPIKRAARLEDEALRNAVRLTVRRHFAVLIVQRIGRRGHRLRRGVGQHCQPPAGALLHKPKSSHQEKYICKSVGRPPVREEGAGGHCLRCGTALSRSHRRGRVGGVLLSNTFLSFKSYAIVLRTPFQFYCYLFLLVHIFGYVCHTLSRCSEALVEARRA